MEFDYQIGFRKDEQNIIYENIIITQEADDIISNFVTWRTRVL